MLMEYFLLIFHFFLSLHRFFIYICILEVCYSCYSCMQHCCGVHVLVLQLQVSSIILLFYTFIIGKIHKTPHEHTMREFRWKNMCLIKITIRSSTLVCLLYFMCVCVCLCEGVFFNGKQFICELRFIFIFLLFVLCH